MPFSLTDADDTNKPRYTSSLFHVPCAVAFASPLLRYYPFDSKGHMALFNERIRGEALPLCVV